MTITLVLHGFRVIPDLDSVELKLEIALRIPIEHLSNFGYVTYNPVDSGCVRSLWH